MVEVFFLNNGLGTKVKCEINDIMEDINKFYCLFHKNDNKLIFTYRKSNK